ncbi:glycoside hydrolase family 16 protein [Vararia minispora EC-137]|uniref:Glycoside hydrolase family 16 protein n=1 Tax=Vararia minispora EC-137 TaxID=1314806 RepID=A0ACB8QW74_9AGAM|nr:glycoside hydrolase family 16 protein [Vararia minispora EC-137]
MAGIVTLLCVSHRVRASVAYLQDSISAGYPIIHQFTTHSAAVANGSANIITSNVPKIPGRFTYIDPDTPQDALTRQSYMDSSQTLKLVFSDEFNVDGRTFYPGDDPFWQAVDLHYWQTADLEWYDPAAITTKGGSLEITLSSKETHGGMLQSWNMMCFTGGLIEASVMLPGAPDVQGLWPAMWMMGNLGRAGYGATTDGLWPYSYDSCDYGTLANQSLGDQPPGVFTPGQGDPFAFDHLSFLPGQRLSRCTCSGESHPGPKDNNGEFVGRSAPEIDIFESQVSTLLLNRCSHSRYSPPIQPMNDGYYWHNGSGSFEIYDVSKTAFNPYRGGAYQQAISGLTHTNQSCYELTGRCYAKFAIEYVPGIDPYISWISNDQLSWTITETAFGADSFVEIGPRPIAQEPMYLIMNLGMAPGFEQPSANLQFPAQLRVDYLRIYQPEGRENIGCDPSGFPTAKYISQYNDAYSNPNYTSWAAAGQTFPKNKFAGQC